LQHSVDAPEGGVRIVQLNFDPAQPPENLGLSLKILDLMVQQGIVHAFAQARGAADYDHGRFFSVGPRDRIAKAQPAHAIGHADSADAVHPGVGIGGKTGAVLASAADQPQGAFFHHRIEGEHVVAGDAENVAYSALSQTADEILADRNARECLLAAKYGRHGTSL